MPRTSASLVYPGASAREPWWRSPDVAVAASLFVADVLLLGQGLFAALLLKVFGVLVPKALLLKKIRRDVWPTTSRAALYGVTAIAIMVTVNFNNFLAQQRADKLVAAIELYHASHGRFPLTLHALVPRYLAAVPRAKLTLAYGDFDYEARGREASLAYIQVPPLEACYDFGQRRRHHVTVRAHQLPNCGRAQSVAQQESER